MKTEKKDTSTENSQTTARPLIKNGVSFTTAVISPSETDTALQVVCFFNFAKNRHYEGGTLAVNKHFFNEIHQLRDTGIFKGAQLETLLITPMTHQIPARQLLLLGMGDPDELNLGLLESLGFTAAMEAIRLEVKDFAFAPSLKDAGIILSFGKNDVSKSLAKGMIRALDASAWMAEKGMIRPVQLQQITLLTGAGQASNADAGLHQAFDAILPC